METSSGISKTNDPLPSTSTGITDTNNPVPSTSRESVSYCMGADKRGYFEVYEHGDGIYTLYSKPRQSGHHTPTRYRGEQVPASPTGLDDDDDDDPVIIGTVMRRVRLNAASVAALLARISARGEKIVYPVAGPDPDLPEQRVDMGPVDLRCKICLIIAFQDGKKVMFGTCGHIFCGSCINEISKKSFLCPTCRKRLRKTHLYEIFY